jgi:hypothetical protein
MEQKKGKKGKIKFVLIGLGVVAVAGTAYYFYNKSQQGKSSSLSDFVETEQASVPLLPDSPRSNGAVKTAQDKPAIDKAFPIRKGSKGKLVKVIQLALIKKYGADLLPKYGADGQWGKETTDALIAKGYPTEIDKSTFVKFIGHGVAESLSISGLQGNDQLKTIRDARVWNVNGQKLPIPRNTIIGEFVDAKDGVTTFETIDNRTLYILTKNISYV